MICKGVGRCDGGCWLLFWALNRLKIAKNRQSSPIFQTYLQMCHNAAASESKGLLSWDMDQGNCIVRRDLRGRQYPPALLISEESCVKHSTGNITRITIQHLYAASLAMAFQDALYLNKFPSAVSCSVTPTHSALFAQRTS